LAETAQNAPPDCGILAGKAVRTVVPGRRALPADRDDRPPEGAFLLFSGKNFAVP